MFLCVSGEEDAPSRTSSAIAFFSLWRSSTRSLAESGSSHPFDAASASIRRASTKESPENLYRLPLPGLPDARRSM
jgi:hypothetical protein